MDFYLYLPSNTGDFPANTLSSFKVKLPEKIDLDGEWEVALVEIGYPFTWLNVATEEDALISISYTHRSEYKTRAIPFNHYTTPEQLCDAINYTMDQMPNTLGENVGFEFRYDHLTQRVGLKPLADEWKNNIHFMRLSPRIQYMLGFSMDTLSPAQGFMYVYDEDKGKPIQVGLQVDELSDENREETYTHINGILERLHTKKGEPVNCYIDYNATTREATLMPQLRHSPNIDRIRFSTNLQARLGLIYDTIIPLTTQRVVQGIQPTLMKRLLTAESMPDLKAGQYSLFVYCDVVQPQIIGNVVAPIIRVVSISGSYGDTIDQHYHNPHYVPVLQKEFDTIEINIKDDTGKDVAFDHGKVFVKLHFRKPKP